MKKIIAEAVVTKAQEKGIEVELGLIAIEVADLSLGAIRRRCSSDNCGLNANIQECSIVSAEQSALTDEPKPKGELDSLFVVSCGPAPCAEPDRVKMLADMFGAWPVSQSTSVFKF